MVIELYKDGCSTVRFHPWLMVKCAKKSKDEHLAMPFTQDTHPWVFEPLALGPSHSKTGASDPLHKNPWLRYWSTRLMDVVR